MLIGGTKSHTDDLKATLTGQGWTVIDNDLNKGCGSSSDYIYLLYKTGNTPGGNSCYDYVTGSSSVGVSVPSGKSLTINGSGLDCGTFTMTGGTISGNSAGGTCMFDGTTTAPAPAEVRNGRAVVELPFASEGSTRPQSFFLKAGLTDTY